MTLIAAYIYRQEVHVFADSVVSSTISEGEAPISPIKKESSFGEVVFVDSGNISEEIAQKIYSYENEVLLTFSGSESSGINVLEDLRILFARTKNEKTSQSIMDYFQNESPANVSFIIAFSEEGKGGLFVYEGSGNMSLTFEDTSFVVLGRGADMPLLKEPLETAIKGFRGKFDPTAEEFNVGIQAILQSAAQNANSFPEGVGGFFNGAFVQKAEITWSPDTIYLLCSSIHFEKMSIIPIVFKYNLMNSVFVSSMSGNFLHLPESIWDDKALQLITEEVKNGLMKKRENCESLYFSVLSIDRIAAVIVKRHTHEEINHINLKFHNSEKLKYRLTSFIKENITNIKEKTVKLILIRQKD